MLLGMLPVVVVVVGELLQQVTEMVDAGELTDASSSLLSPTLLGQLSASGHHSTETETFLNLAGVEVATGSSSADHEPPSTSVRAKEKSLKRRRKRMYTAPIDEGIDCMCVWSIAILCISVLYNYRARGRRRC